MKQTFLLIFAGIIFFVNCLNAQNNTFVIGGGSGELLITMDSNGEFNIERESYPGIWERQIYRTTEVFSIKIGMYSYTSYGTEIGGDVINIVGTRGEYSKTFKISHYSSPWIIAYPCYVTIKTIYDTSNPDYYIMEATINSDSIPAGDLISLAFGFDSYVNGCDGGAAWVLPDVNNYNGLDTVLDLTAAEVRNLKFVGAINDIGLGSLMGFFQVDRAFDWAYSNYYTMAYPSSFINYPFNSFLFGPTTIPSCGGGSTWDNGVAVAYDNIPTGSTTVINTGLTFTDNLYGTLDYTWSGLKDKQTSIGSADTLILSYFNLGLGVVDSIEFRSDFPGLGISSSCISSSWLQETADCAIGSDYYKMNTGAMAGDSAVVKIPITVGQYGEWIISAASISETKKTLPTGVPAKLIAPTKVNRSSISSDTICRGDSAVVTVKLDGIGTTSQDITVELDYTGSTATASEFSYLPNSVIIPANSNSAAFTIKSNDLLMDHSLLIITLTGTDRDFATIGANLSYTLVLSDKARLTTPLVNTVCSNSPFMYTALANQSAVNFNWIRPVVAGISNSAGSGNNATINETLINATNTPVNVKYLITLTGPTICSYTDTLVVTVNPSPTVILNDTTICEGTTATLIVSNPIAGAVYHWYTNTRLVHTGISFTTNVLNASSSYGLKVISGVCSDSITVDVTVKPLPIVALNDTTICEGSTVRLAITNPIAGVVYNWYSGSTLLHSGLSFTTPSLSATTNYRVEVIDGICSNFKNIKVTVKALPILNINNETTCEGSTAILQVLNSVPDAIYNWYSGTNLLQSSADKKFVTPILHADAVYRVEIISGICSNTKLVDVSVTPTPTLNINDETICEGTTATLIVSNPIAGAVYHWYTNTRLVHTGISFTTNVLSTSSSYGLKVISGVCSDSITVDVTVKPLPIVALNDTTICEGSTVRLAITNPIAGGVYNWYSGSTLLHSGLSFTTPSLSATTNYRVEVIDGICSNFKNIKVTVKALPILNINNETTCEGSTAILQVLSSVPDAIYNWYSGTNLLQSSADKKFVTPILHADAVYQVEIISGICSNTKLVDVSVTPTPTLNINDETIYEGSTATLTLLNPISGAVYNWYSGTNLLYTGTSFITPALNANTSYIAEIVKGTCIVKQAVNVIVTPLPVIGLRDTIICAGNNVSYSIPKPIAGVVYEWYFGLNLVHTGFNFTSSVLNSNTIYTLKIINGQVKYSEVINVTVIKLEISTQNPLPRYLLDANYHLQFESNAHQPNYTVDGGNLPFGLTLSSNGVLQGLINSGNDYNFKIKVTDTYGCEVAKQFKLKKKLFIPEVFSPNGDGINDLFMKGYKVIIFDRLGLKLYEGDDGWDGTYKNNVMTPDSYFYILYNDNDGKEERLTGCIVLLKH